MIIMHLKIGHGHEEKHRKESYVVLSPQSTHNLPVGKK